MAVNAAKIRLSKEELALVTDAGWILTKNSIMEKVIALMADLSAALEKEKQRLIVPIASCSYDYEPPPNWNTSKISRGENYKGLPYVIHDYPRIFTKEHILSIRTMFWWGHYFSVTLHLKGWLIKVTDYPIQRHLGNLKAAGFRISVAGDEWRHELDDEYYQDIDENLDIIENGDSFPFLKLAARCPLDRWSEAPEILLGLNKLLIDVIAGEPTSSPTGEKDL